MKNQTTFLKSVTVYGLFFSVLVLSGGFFASCSKDDDSPEPVSQVAPINNIFFIDYPFSFKSTGSGYYEYGFTFKVAKKGKVTKLGCRMPEDGNYRVALWDSTSKSYMVEKTITAKGSELKLESITPMPLQAGTTYLITIYSNLAWYQFNKLDGSTIKYPLVKGNISLSGYYWKSSSAGAAPVFPTNKDNTYAAGLPDMEFVTD